jgi:hypothetical protein
MTLNSQTSYPSARSYVLKLHRDAMPAHGQIFGRLESLSSGHRFDFGSGEELLARLAQDATPIDSEPRSAGPHGSADAEDKAV